MKAHKDSMQALSQITECDTDSASFIFIENIGIDIKHLDIFGKAFFNELSVQGVLNPTSSGSVTEILRSFYEDYLPSIPPDLTPQRGSNSITGLLCNWLILKILNPHAYTESGVFIGGSLRLADFALPNAQKFAYDISLRHLRYRPSHIHFVESEWSDNLPALNLNQINFAFFDDHIDPVRRIKEAKAAGIGWLLFDDCPKIARLYRYRYPAVPSISMIMDQNIQDGAEFHWRHRSSSRLLKYRHDAEYCGSARGDIEGFVDLSSIFSSLGLDCGDKFLVKLR